MTNTQVGRLNETLEYMQIESLTIRNWEKANMNFLKGRRILHIDAKSSKIDLSKYIQELPLVSLNISETPFKDWEVLNTLRFLKKLYVSKNQIPEHIKKQLPAELEIIIE